MDIISLLIPLVFIYFYTSQEKYKNSKNRHKIKKVLFTIVGVIFCINLFVFYKSYNNDTILEIWNKKKKTLEYIQIHNTYGDSLTINDPLIVEEIITSIDNNTKTFFTVSPLVICKLKFVFKEKYDFIINYHITSNNMNILSIDNKNGSTIIDYINNDLAKILQKNKNYSKLNCK